MSIFLMTALLALSSPESGEGQQPTIEEEPQAVRTFTVEQTREQLLDEDRLTIADELPLPKQKIQLKAIQERVFAKEDEEE